MIKLLGPVGLDYAGMAAKIPEDLMNELPERYEEIDAVVVPTGFTNSIQNPKDDETGIECLGASPKDDESVKDTCVVRFHRVRLGQQWLNEDLESYEDPIAALDFSLPR